MYEPLWGLPEDQRRKVAELVNQAVSSVIHDFLLLLGNAAGTPAAGVEGLGYSFAGGEGSSYRLSVEVGAERVTINDDLKVLLGDTESVREFIRILEMY
jgi:hypothetical protein